MNVNRRMKIIIITLLTLVMIISGWLYKRLSYANMCLDLKTDTQIENCLEILPRLHVDLDRLYKVIRIPVLGEVVTIMNEIESFMLYKDYLLGVDTPTNYIFLLLNDQELRTNGGFMGSYAKATINNRVLDVSFEDIYVPDGQIEGYIEPPKPIQEAFKTGAHRLPNSDWSPDFVLSAAAIRWFFDKGGEVNPDILITITLETVKEIIKIVGPIEVLEYNVTLSEENIYMWLQSNAEFNFFPGSTQKKDAITALGNALIRKIKNLSWKQQLQIATLLISDLNKQNILVSSLNDDVEKIILNKNWGGEYFPLPCPESLDCQMITTGVVEMNLGANKANCCVERKTHHILEKIDENIVHSIEVRLENNSIHEAPIKPDFYGGNYLSYFRFYIPVTATDIQVTATPSVLADLGTWPEPYDGVRGKLDTDVVYGFKEIGLFHLTKAHEESTLKVSYRIQDQNAENLWFSILKQHGVKRSPQTITVFGKSFSDNLENDFLLKTEH